MSLRRLKLSIYEVVTPREEGGGYDDDDDDGGGGGGNDGNDVTVIFLTIVANSSFRFQRYSWRVTFCCQRIKLSGNLRHFFLPLVSEADVSAAGDNLEISI
jgi:hypothetical protein